MATSTLSDRFQAVTQVKKSEEFRSMSFAQLAEMRISFGESKLNEKFIAVVEQDPKYVQWFTKKYADSKKPSHQAFLYFIEIYVERMELEKGIEESQVPKSTAQPMLSSKSKAAPRKAIDLESQGSWSDSEPSKPWSVVQEENQIIHEELSVQRDRITSMESSLSQIAQQLQSLMQLTAQQKGSQSAW